MNKLLPIIAGVLVVGGGAAAIYISRGSDDAAVKVTNSEGTSQDVKVGEAALVNVDACEVLTERAAKQILGAGAAKADLKAANASTPDVSVTNCVYTVEIVPGKLGPNNTKGVSVLARSGKTKTGADSNLAVFDNQKPAGVQDVAGIGDKAYFNPQFGQLNVLKGGNWYILTNYSGSATSGTLDSAKQLADLLSFK